jgi:hypothetical protein
MQNLSRGASVAVDAIALSQLKRTDFESQNSRWAAPTALDAALSQ